MFDSPLWAKILAGVRPTWARFARDPTPLTPDIIGGRPLMSMGRAWAKVRKKLMGSLHHTLISVTGSGHIKYKKRHLPYEIKGKSSCQGYLSFYKI